ncbi:MAG: hypothetical protein JXQ71_05100 [Verrucomicrobia bacterium]|nr:hypothetical protein [Verrucomicrobiota bacterium]
MVVGLGAALWDQQREARGRLAALGMDFHRWSNRWQQSQETLTVTAQQVAQLHTLLRLRDTFLATTSNELATATNRLAETAAVVAEQQADIAAAGRELAARDGQVLELQARVRHLERTLADLQTQHARLREQYAQAQERERRQETTLAALRLERELMHDRAETLEAAERTLRGQLAALQGDLDTVRARCLAPGEAGAAGWVEALAVKFERLEQTQARWSNLWTNRSALSNRLVQLQSTGTIHQTATPPVR